MLGRITVNGARMTEKFEGELGDHTNPPHPHKSDLNQFDKFRLQ